MKDIRETMNRKKFVFLSLSFVFLVLISILLIAVILDLFTSNMNDMVLSSLIVSLGLAFILYKRMQNKDSYFFIILVIGCSASFLTFFSPLVVSLTSVLVYLVLTFIVYLVLIEILGGLIYDISHWYKDDNFITFIISLEYFLLVIFGLILILANPFQI